ncbi:hypothetical protein THERMOT_1947 [Bathymodiolus thermophilus thioautotrophic gill symbiont]|nr:hypothetical protein THERMOT_1947 [Bathymodiolus thermophilus thioautotrophic gill symbiont]
MPIIQIYAKVSYKIKPLYEYEQSKAILMCPLKNKLCY